MGRCLSALPCIKTEGTPLREGTFTSVVLGEVEFELSGKYLSSKLRAESINLL